MGERGGSEVDKWVGIFGRRIEVRRYVKIMEEGVVRKEVLMDVGWKFGVKGDGNVVGNDEDGVWDGGVVYGEFVGRESWGGVNVEVVVFVEVGDV